MNDCVITSSLNFPFLYSYCILAVKANKVCASRCMFSVLLVAHRICLSTCFCSFSAYSRCFLTDRPIGVCSMRITGIFSSVVCQGDAGCAPQCHSSSASDAQVLVGDPHRYTLSASTLYCTVLRLRFTTEGDQFAGTSFYVQHLRNSLWFCRQYDKT